MIRRLRSFAAAVLATAALACGGSPPSLGGGPVASLLEDPSRSTADREKDAMRRPVEVLAVAGVDSGMQVADLMAGGGWYTEVLSRVVGPEGRVFAQNNSVSASRYG